MPPFQSYGWRAALCPSVRAKSAAPFLLKRILTSSHQSAYTLWWFCLTGNWEATGRDTLLIQNIINEVRNSI